MDAAVEFAEASPFPAPESLYDDVYVLDDAGARLVLGQDHRRQAAPAPRARAPQPNGTGEIPSRSPARCRPARTARVSRWREMRYREALNAALREELSRDERVMLMGEDIGVFGGAFKVTDGLLEEFGESRVRDTPISENTIVGMGVGAAMTGLRPVVELMTINFALLAFDQIVNHAAHIHYMFGGQATVPLVVRMPQGAGHQLGPTHSHCLEALFLHVPGLLVAVPSTAADAKGLLKAAIRDENPVIFIEHESLYGVRGEVPEDEEHLVAFGRARIAREGSDVTIVGVSRMALTAERAAETLAAEHGVQAEVIDPRTLRPLDLDTILASVRKTNRCVVVEEGWPHGGVGANLAALISEQAFDDLDAPVARVTGADVPMPYSKPLEDIAYPHEPQIVHAALAILGLRTAAAGTESALMADIVMPRLSDTMEEGTILRWLKRDGEQVRRGEELVEIETDKATMSYESDLEGVLQTVAGEGDTLAVGELIARIGEAKGDSRRVPGSRRCVGRNGRGAASEAAGVRAMRWSRSIRRSRFLHGGGVSLRGPVRRRLTGGGARQGIAAGKADRRARAGWTCTR